MPATFLNYQASLYLFPIGRSIFQWFPRGLYDKSFFFRITQCNVDTHNTRTLTLTNVHTQNLSLKAPSKVRPANPRDYRSHHRRFDVDYTIWATSFVLLAPLKKLLISPLLYVIHLMSF